MTDPRPTVPISDVEWFAFGELVLDLLREALLACGPRHRELLICDFRFVGELLQRIHRAAEAPRLAGGEPGECTLDWDGNPGCYSRLIGERANVGNRLRLRFRSMAKTGAFALGTLRHAGASVELGDVVGIGTMTTLKKEYLRRRGILSREMYLEEFLAPATGMPPTWAGAIGEPVGRFLESIATPARDFGVNIDVERLAQGWRRRLDDLGAIYALLAARERWPREIVMTDVASPLAKVFAFAARSRGAKVSGVSHGNYINLLHYKIFAFAEPSQFDEFLVPTQSAANAVSKKYAMAGLEKIFPVEFRSTGSQVFGGLRDRFADTPPAATPGRVMLMGFPMNAHRYLDEAGAYSKIRLDLELRLVGVLKRLGYTVIYKGHPDRRKEVTGIFDGIADKVMFERFETVWQQADTILFTIAETSCLHTAMCSNRRLVLLDHEDTRWYRPIYEAVARRCEMVPAWFDERNLIEFDEARLAEACAGGITVPDTSVIDEYFVETRPMAGDQAQTA